MNDIDSFYQIAGRYPADLKFGSLAGNGLSSVTGAPELLK